MSKLTDGTVRDDFGNPIGHYYVPDRDKAIEMVGTRVAGLGLDAMGVRIFDTGATRSNDEERIDPEGFCSPIALEEFCNYMHKHRRQADGSLRASDNWQKGIPFSTYIKGMLRHVLHAWQRHRGWKVTDPKAAADLKEDLCAIWFNAQGALHELLKEERRA